MTAISHVENSKKTIAYHMFTCKFLVSDSYRPITMPANHDISDNLMLVAISVIQRRR